MKVAKVVKGDDGKNGTDKTGAENGVLFPRLNVKETKTAGPRAPPRNKMALYEQFTIPSHRFVQPSHGAARQSPSALLNQPASCDGRFMYTPYYVSPNAYATVNYPGQFLGQNLISRTNITATESDKSTKCALAKSREHLSGTASYSNPGVSKSKPNPNPLSTAGIEVEDSSPQSSHRLSNNNLMGRTTVGGSHVHKSGQRTSNPVIACASEGLITVPLQVDNVLKSPVQHSQSAVLPSDRIGHREREAGLCKDGSQPIHGDAYFVEDRLCLPRCQNEGAEDDSRVDDDENYQSKNSSSSDNIADSKGVDHFSSGGECQGVGQSHGIHEAFKSSLACVELQYAGENTSRDLQNAMDGIQRHDESQKKQSLRDQCKSKPCNDHQSMVVDSGPHDVGKGDPSDRNSDSSMVDSVHIFDITPNNVIAAIGQKEFWRVRKAILRQQKIFSTQVFELHRLLKVQKLIAISSNLLIEDNAYENIPICTSEEQCVPAIDPEKFPESLSIHVNHNSEIAVNKGKTNDKEASPHSSIPSHLSAKEIVQPLKDTEDRSDAAPFPVASVVPGSASAWGYPAYSQNSFGMASHPRGYVCYHPYPFNHLGSPGTVMGIPFLEGNSTSAPNVHGCQHQSQCTAEYHANVPGHFPKYPFPDGFCYNSTGPVASEFFKRTSRAPHSFSEGGLSVGNGSRDEMAAGSFGFESALKQKKQLTHLSADRSSNIHHSQGSVTKFPVRQDNVPVVQSQHHGPSSTYRNSVHHCSESLSEKEWDDTFKRDERFNSMDRRHLQDGQNYEGHMRRESDKNCADIPAARDLENQALSLFPMSSSVSYSSEMVRDESHFSSNEQRVRVIKSVPRAAMAASESTADILLSLQRERQQ